jgi:hypothetical protein
MLVSRTEKKKSFFVTYPGAIPKGKLAQTPIRTLEIIAVMEVAIIISSFTS